ncbi:putative pectin lyase F-1 [Colletotrichum gloeosporioides]|uniref:pectin lyase n=1 Tax=Colletotrichum gloeosporioides TaxID=474922 RepID=A0A8H4C869_COLGL|nr:putative pectin lyase F-1 [Colletotrichum gloeosporioides]KAF3799228.1 putative pectin lyase F-1 [Colletotrichum gloeosporioides]
MKSFFLSIVAAAAAGKVAAQVTGEAFGFATGTTGGGDAKPQVPSSNEELFEWLTDSQPRTIMIDRLFDFLETEGSTDGTCCRDEKSYQCKDSSRHGQVYIGDDCGDMQKISCTYWNAPTRPIYVASNKSIVGVGESGIIRGKGFRMSHDVSNVIFQNIHITELNPEYIWGGDAISLDGTDKIWIDHCKTSLIGRQHIVSGWGPAGAVTISHHEFDGKMDFSCNQQHYYNALLIASKANYTFAYNYLHHVSGRAPNVGGSEEVMFQGVNNLWEGDDDHAFAIGDHIQALVEGNHFENVSRPIEPSTYNSAGEIFVVETSADAAACQGPMGRPCEPNSVGGQSGELLPLNKTVAIDKLKYASESLLKPMKVSEVPEFVKANAGVGKLHSSSPPASSASTAFPTLPSSVNGTSGLAPTPTAVPTSSAFFSAAAHVVNVASSASRPAKSACKARRSLRFKRLH